MIKITDKVKKDDIVYNVIGKDTHGYFLESIDENKIRKYETDISNYKLIERIAVDKNGEIVEVNNWISVAGNVLKVIKVISDGSVLVNEMKEPIKETDYTLTDAPAPVRYFEEFNQGPTKVFLLENKSRKNFYREATNLCLGDLNADYKLLGFINQTDLGDIESVLNENLTEEERMCCIVKQDDMVSMLTKFGMKLFNEDQILKYKKHSFLGSVMNEDHVRCENPSTEREVQLNDWVKAGVRDVAGNLKIVTVGKVIDIKDDSIIIVNEIGDEVAFDKSCVQRSVFIDN